MEQTLHILKNPIRTGEAQWLFQYNGRMSAARETEEDGTVDILAYSDNPADFAQIENMADIPGGCVIHNVSELEVDCIDGLAY
jgi:hypothetical protein